MLRRYTQLSVHMRHGVRRCWVMEVHGLMSQNPAVTVFCGFGCADPVSGLTAPGSGVACGCAPLF